MHTIDGIDKNIRTDLIVEKEIVGNYSLDDENIDDIYVSRGNDNNNKFSTIFFNDITDKDNFNKVQKVFIKELKKYIEVRDGDSFLIIGLGNDKSTPDSLGPKVIDKILVTGYLFMLGEVEKGYSNVSVFIPNVTGNTGLESASVIKSIINSSNINKVIVVDALKTNQMRRLTKTIQITNEGIFPGSGIGNTRKEISLKTMGVDVLAIGVPTVVDIENIVKKKEEIINNYIVTPTDIDFMIEKLSILIGDGLNSLLHENFIRQNNY